MKKLTLFIFLILFVVPIFAQTSSPITLSTRVITPIASPLDSVIFSFTGKTDGYSSFYTGRKINKLISAIPGFMLDTLTNLNYLALINQNNKVAKALGLTYNSFSNSYTWVAPVSFNQPVKYGVSTIGTGVAHLAVLSDGTVVKDTTKFGGGNSFGNGLNSTSGIIGLGGNLNTNTTINTGAYQFYLSDVNGNGFGVLGGSGGNTSLTGGNNSQINLNAGAAVIDYFSPSGAINYLSIGNQLSVNDNYGSIGLVNTGDYTTNILANQNALTSTKAVKTLISNSGVINKANKVNVRVYFLVGESNSAGEIPITEANATDTLVSGHVNILNNNTLNIEPLHVGVNSTLGVNSSNAFFGPEVSILESTQTTDTVYIVKIAYAGATIAFLQSQLPTAYSRIDTALKQIRAFGKTPIPYIIYSQGINDEGVGDTTTWKNLTLSYIRSIRNHIGYAPVLMTQFMPAYNSFNPVIANLVNYDDWDYPISATNATTGTNGPQHWNKAGWNLIYSRMSYVINTTISGKENYLKTEGDKAALQNYPIYKSITLERGFGMLSWGNSNITQNNLLLYDGGSTSSRTGVGLNKLSANLQLFANSASNIGTINIGVGYDASTLTSTNGAVSIDGNNKVHVINQLLFGASPTANIQGNYGLLYDGGSTSARTGFGLTNNSSSVLSLFGANEIRLGTHLDATTLTDANAALYVNSSNQPGLNGQVNLNGLLSFGSANVTGTGIRLYDGGTSSTRTGFTLNSTQAHAVLYSYGPGGYMLLGVGNDETSMTTSNAAAYINTSNNFVFNGAPQTTTANPGTGGTQIASQAYADASGVSAGYITSSSTNTLTNKTIVNSGVQATVQNIWECFGDSRTAGLEPPSGTPHPYTVQLASLTGYTVNNYGVGGYTSTQVRTAFLAQTATQLSHPQIIWCGANNMPDTTTIKADIAAMVAVIPHNNYLILGEVPTPSQLGNENSTYNVIIAYNKSMAKIYGKHFIDIRTYMMSQLNTSNSTDVSNYALDILPSTLTVDGLHYTDLGYNLIAQRIYQQKDVLDNTPQSLNYDKIVDINRIGVYPAGSVQRTDGNFNRVVTDELDLSTYGGVRQSGTYILHNSTTAGTSLSVGYQAGYNSYNPTSGLGQTAIGFYALKANVSATFNTAIGTNALLSQTAGGFNTAIGTNSLLNCTTGGSNIAVGLGALQSVVSTNASTGIGVNAIVNATGAGNIGIGYNSGNNLTSGANNIVIGYNNQMPSATASNQLNIQNAIYGTGNSSTTTSPSTGNIGIFVTSPTARLQLPAGSASASQSPFKFTTGVSSQTIVEQGAVNWDGTRLYIGSGSTPVNQTFAYQSDFTPYALLGSSNNFTAGQLFNGATLKSNSKLQWYDSSNSFLSTLQSGNYTANYTWTLPAATGTIALTNQVPILHSVVTSAATTLTLAYNTDYSFLPSATANTTWSVPAVSATLTGVQNGINIYNESATYSITLSGTNLFKNGVQTTITVPAYGACIIYSDGTYNLYK